MKQGPSHAVGKFLFQFVLLAAFTVLAALVSPGQAHAQSLHFVSVAWVLPEKQGDYDRFNEKVKPIWARHGMEVLLRGRVIGALEGENPTKLPSEIVVLRLAGRKQFQDYIEDPDYRRIRPDRMDAIAKMIVLEGTVDEPSANPLFATAPQFAIKFSNSSGGSGTNGVSAGGAVPMFELSTSHVGSIRGAMPPLYASKPQITLFAMSYDDNPMGFTDGADSDSTIIIVQRID